MPAPSEEKPFMTYPGRSRPKEIEDRLEDKSGRSLVRQHDAEPKWGEASEDRLRIKRHRSGTPGVF
jgi:hypothetical protein